jgi:hypothetical protein
MDHKYLIIGDLLQVDSSTIPFARVQEIVRKDGAIVICNGNKVPIVIKYKSDDQLKKDHLQLCVPKFTMGQSL